VVSDCFFFSAGEENQFAYPVTYFIILAMLATIFMQLHWLTVGLQWFDAVFVIPVFQCLFITVTIIGGAVYFKELSSFGLLQSVMFPLGVGFILFGIILLSQRDMSKKIPRMRTRCVSVVIVLVCPHHRDRFIVAFCGPGCLWPCSCFESTCWRVVTR
jgi:hypothetical protein